MPLRCHFDAGHYQVAVEPIIWRTYAPSLPPDALEADIQGHRAASYWVMKPTSERPGAFLQALAFSRRRR
jgi:hypothetical protein